MLYDPGHDIRIPFLHQEEGICSRAGILPLADTGLSGSKTHTLPNLVQLAESSHGYLDMKELKRKSFARQ